MLRNLALLLAGLCLLAGTPGQALAKLRLPKVISSHMVLQQGKPIYIWGWANPGEAVEVSFADSKRYDRADFNGRWVVAFPSMKASFDSRSMEIRTESGDASTLEDILIGEVWLASGQSNMEWNIFRTKRGPGEILSAVASFPHLRTLHVPKRPMGMPTEDIDATWQRTEGNQALKWFSAVGFFFGMRIRTEMNVPVGIIASSFGGTRIESWTPLDGLRADVYGELADKILNGQKQYLNQLSAWLPKQQQWLVQTRWSLLNGGDSIPPLTVEPKNPIGHQNDPTSLYNGMIHPLTPLSIRGVIWYQGEANMGDSQNYTWKMKALIESWRDVFRDEKLPFYYVQLAPFLYGKSVYNLPKLRDAQTNVLKLVPHTGMAVTMDIGNLRDIHPRNKKTVSDRLAVIALAKTYGKEIPYSGPMFRSLKVEGPGRVRVSFDHTAGGLRLIDPDKPLTWFRLGDEEGHFYRVNAEIDGHDIILTQPKVEKPKYVRYGWDVQAETNLANSAGLPAVPFRSDNLPVE